MIITMIITMTITITHLKLYQGEEPMNIRIAISANDNNGIESKVSEHFGRCPYFIIVDVEENAIQSVQAIDNPYYANHAPGHVPEFIHRQGAGVMLTGGMGLRAVGFFEQYGIEVATGAAGTAQQAVQAYLEGKLRGASPCAESRRHHGHGHKHSR
jgi:predicted Fe-Mo cluster-binding NifX family protein